ncbi:hypothetical protein M1M96_00735 [Peptococcaceae bacterium]|jgi:hypothetical protein|nr:hypothetical protein [Peptococcaceae bacterium]MCL0052017.1 hypothetical protein [Peptococcaceae bacterium]MCL0100907.1 hypothetical protein [Peptococcaceae bacterium]
MNTVVISTAKKGKAAITSGTNSGVASAISPIMVLLIKKLAEIIAKYVKRTPTGPRKNKPATKKHCEYTKRKNKF